MSVSFPTGLKQPKKNHEHHISLLVVLSVLSIFYSAFTQPIYCLRGTMNYGGGNGPDIPMNVRNSAYIQNNAINQGSIPPQFEKPAAFFPPPPPSFTGLTQPGINNWQQQPMMNQYNNNNNSPGLGTSRNPPSSPFPPPYGGNMYPPQFQSNSVQYPNPQVGGCSRHQPYANNPYQHQCPFSNPKQQQQQRNIGNPPNTSGSCTNIPKSVISPVTVPTNWCPCQCTDNKQINDDMDNDEMDRDERDTYIIVKPRKRRHSPKKSINSRLSQPDNETPQSVAASQSETSPLPSLPKKNKLSTGKRIKTPNLRSRNNNSNLKTKKSISQTSNRKKSPVSGFLRSWFGRKMKKPKVAGPNTTKRAMAQVNKVMSEVNLGSILKNTGISKQFPKLGRMLKRVRTSMSPMISKLKNRARNAVKKGVQKLKSKFRNLKSKFKRKRNTKSIKSKKISATNNKKKTSLSKKQLNKRQVNKKNKKITKQNTKKTSRSSRRMGELFNCQQSSRKKVTNKKNRKTVIHDLPDESNEEIIARVTPLSSDYDDGYMHIKSSSFKRCMRLPSKYRRSCNSQHHYRQLNHRQRKSLYQHPIAIPIRKRIYLRPIKRIIQEEYDSGMEEMLKEIELPTLNYQINPELYHEDLQLRNQHVSNNMIDYEKELEFEDTTHQPNFDLEI